MNIKKLIYNQIYNKIFITRNIVFILNVNIKNMKSVHVLDDIAGHTYHTQFIENSINTL